MINLLHGDCLELMKDIPDNSIDCVLTDPPYGTTACRWDNVIDFELMWEQLKRITKDNGAICLFGSEPFSSSLRMSNIKMFKYDWYWNKGRGSNFLNFKYQPAKSIEIVSVFGVGATSFVKSGKNLKYKPIMEKGKPYSQIQGRGGDAVVREGSRNAKVVSNNKGTRYPKCLLEFKYDKSKIHPTQKPIALLEYLIKTHTLKNETVLDFTMGSGSTGVACKNLSRKFIGIEKDETYFNIAKKRINDFIIK